MCERMRSVSAGSGWQLPDWVALAQSHTLAPPVELDFRLQSVDACHHSAPVGGATLRLSVEVLEYVVP